jgi:hypothetical protein
MLSIRLLREVIFGGSFPVAMRNLYIIIFGLWILLLAGCSAKKRSVAQVPVAAPQSAAPAPVRSQMPPPNAEVIEHCVVTKQENANTVACRCEPVTTRIDSKTGHTVIVCKKMPQEGRKISQ